MMCICNYIYTYSMTVCTCMYIIVYILDLCVVGLGRFSYIAGWRCPCLWESDQCTYSASTNGFMAMLAFKYILFFLFHSQA